MIYQTIINCIKYSNSIEINEIIPTYDLTCDKEFLVVAGFALFLHRDFALIVPRIVRPGGIEFIHDRVFLGGWGVDDGIVPPDLEGVGEVPDIAG